MMTNAFGIFYASFWIAMDFWFLLRAMPTTPQKPPSVAFWMLWWTLRPSSEWMGGSAQTMAAEARIAQDRRETHTRAREAHPTAIRHRMDPAYGALRGLWEAPRTLAPASRKDPGAEGVPAPWAS